MTRQEILRLALEVGCSQRTVERWVEDPLNVAAATRYALEKATAAMAREAAETERPGAE